MKLKKKSWLWKLTFPFAHNNNTAIWETIYFSGNRLPTNETIRHETSHSKDQKSWGKIFLPVWIFLYLFGLPFFWNPLRWKTEKKAFLEGSGYSEKYTRMLLKSYRYGWLIFHD